MDIKAIADQVMSAVGDSPEAIKDLLSDPAGAIEGITGHRLEGSDLSGVVDHVREGIAGGGIELPGGLDLGDVAKGLGDALGDSPLSGLAEGLGGLLGRK